MINVSSVAGLKVLAPIGTMYTDTKFAVRTISEGPAREGIRRHPLDDHLVRSGQ